MPVEYTEFYNKEELITAAEDYISSRIDTVLREKSHFTIALAGGSSPEKLYSRLALNKKINWKRVFFFWGDERMVLRTDERSNYRMVFDALLSKVNVKEENIIGIPTDSEPRKCAALYEKRIIEFFRTPMPSFDIILLGMGPDGHTASLFPGTTAAAERKRLVIWTGPPPLNPKVSRITMTLPLINNAAGVLFLVTGENKQGVLREIMDKRPGAEKKYPAAAVLAEKTIWFYT